MRMCWAAFALDAEESGWDDFITSRKSISSSPTLSVTEDVSAEAAVTNVVMPTSPITPTSTSLPVHEDRLWTSEMTKFEPTWHKEIGAIPVAEPVIVDHDVDMAMDMDLDIEQETLIVKDIVVSTPSEHHLASAVAPIVTPSEQQEWIKTIDAQIEQNQKQLEITTVEISRVEEVIKPAKRYIPTKITAYFPSSPILSVRGMELSVSSNRVTEEESDEEKQEREILEELAKSLSGVSLRTRSRTQQLTKSKPPPIGIGMMMGYKSARSETPSPRLKNDAEMHTKITKRGVIAGNRGGAGKGRGLIRRRHSTGRGDTICL